MKSEVFKFEFTTRLRQPISGIKSMCVWVASAHGTRGMFEWIYNLGQGEAELGNWVYPGQVED